MNPSWQPFDRITEIKVHVDPNIVWPLGYEPQESYKIPAKAGKFYRRARVAVSDPKPMASPKQARYNATHKTCPRCDGRGYTRRDKNIGCHVCLGRGAVAE